MNYRTELTSYDMVIVAYEEMIEKMLEDGEINLPMYMIAKDISWDNESSDGYYNITELMISDFVAYPKSFILALNRAYINFASDFRHIETMDWGNLNEYSHEYMSDVYEYFVIMEFEKRMKGVK